MRQLAENTAAADSKGDGKVPALIDDEIETLYAGFQKIRKGQHGESEQAWVEAEEKSKKLRREEGKIRALNGNGRVDYSIQE